MLILCLYARSALLLPDPTSTLGVPSLHDGTHTGSWQTWQRLCRVAVEREDYDMAKALKQDIDKLRAAGEAAATGHIAELPKSRRATDPEEIFNRVLGRCVQSAAEYWPRPELSLRLL